MTSRGLWVWIAVAACRGAAPSARDRVLEQLPAGVEVVAAADSGALADPRFRPVVDALRPLLPSSAGCAIDAALAGDAVALGVGPGQLTLVVASRRRPDAACSVLSRIDDGLWVATLGAGAAADHGAAVATASFARARPYLARAPVAVAMVAAGGQLIATAQPSPLEAWMAIDTTEALAAPLEVRLRDELAQLAANPSTAAFAAAASIERQGAQVVARLGPAPGDLAMAVRTVVARVEGTRERARPVVVAGPPFECPPPRAPVVSCARKPPGSSLGDPVFEVVSLARGLELLASAPSTPVVRSGVVHGVRLAGPIPALGLIDGDIVLAISGRAVRGRSEIARLVEPGRRSATLTVQRGAIEQLLRLDEL